MDHRLYVGPYARCKNPTVKAMRQTRTCPKLDCTGHSLAHRSETFCSTCGTKIRDVDVETTAHSVSWADVEEDFEADTLSVMGIGSRERFKDFDIWIPNSSGWCGRTVRFDSFAGVQRLGTTTPESDKTQFADEFAAELVVLRKHYGEHSVEVNWGVVGDWR